MVSILLSLGLSFTAHSLGQRLMDETLQAESDDYISRRLRNPNSLPPSTASVEGYFLEKGKKNESVPPELISLPEGTSLLYLKGSPYRVLVVEKNGDKYFMMFNESRQNHREKTFTSYMVAGVLIMILISIWMGWWLAGKVVAPIEELARRVFLASPEDGAETLAQGFQNDEIGLLAQVFSGYLVRMREFINRERSFTSDVSHELRTPLSIVQGVVELMEEDRLLDSKQQERVERIGRVNREMINLTTALLLMAREYTHEAVVEACDVSEVVSIAIEMNRHLLSKMTELSFLSQANPNICADRTLLSVVVSNLIRNALMLTPSGTITIRLEDTTLTIIDTGIGIREEEIGKVFQPYFKGTGSSGSGIGLSLVKRICDRYGWEIVIDSIEGKGTIAKLVFMTT